MESNASSTNRGMTDVSETDTEEVSWHRRSRDAGPGSTTLSSVGEGAAARICFGKVTITDLAWMRIMVYRKRRSRPDAKRTRRTGANC